MKRFASIAAATAIAATCLVMPSVSADEAAQNSDKCVSLKAQAAEKGYDKLSAQEYATAIRKDLLKQMGKESYKDLTDREKKGLRSTVARFVNAGYECQLFAEPKSGSAKGGSASGSGSSGLFFSS